MCKDTQVPRVQDAQERRIPNDWQEKSLGSVLQRIADTVNPEPNTLYQEIGIRSHGKGIFHKEPVLGKQLGNKRVFKVHPDCFVVNIVFAWEQAVAKTTKHEAGMIASHRFPMYRSKNNQCDIDYLTYFFKTKKGKYLLELASPGGAGRNKTLGQKEFAKLRFSMPDGNEQKLIAKILLTWDNAIEVTEDLIKNSQTQKKALMQQLLTGKKRLSGFKGKWNEVKLHEISEILVSNVDKKTDASETPVRLCNYTDVYYNNYITDDIDFMQATAKAIEIKKFQLFTNDLIITKDSETPDDIAIPALVTESLHDVICGYHLAIIRPDKNKADGKFLSALFSLPRVRYYFFTLANGATRFGLSVGSIKNAIFNMPNLKEQKMIGEIIFEMNSEIKNLQRQLEDLNSQKKALMQQLLTGKRRVKVDKTAA